MAQTAKIRGIVSSIDAMLDEINKYSFEKATTAKKRSAKKKQLSNLDSKFWDSIKDLIGEMLVKNYNQIRIMNQPKYWNWKKRAIQEGITVKVTDSESKPVTYVRPALRTGHLREVLRNVEIDRQSTVESSRDGVFEVIFDIGAQDLYRNYGQMFRQLVIDRTGEDIFVLTEEQIAIIFDIIARRYQEE